MDRITYHGTPYATIHGMTEPIYSDYPIRAIMNKLAEYEDAEEQGLLLRLPCPVGSKIYSVIKDGLSIIELKLSLEYYVKRKNDFGKTVFLTKEEAEQALQNMKAGETE